MQEIAIKNSAEISQSITKKTSILVVGLDAGSKLDKAQEKDISIISDNEFMQMLNLKDRDIIILQLNTLGTTPGLVRNNAQFACQ